MSKIELANPLTKHTLLVIWQIQDVFNTSKNKSSSLVLKSCKSIQETRGCSLKLDRFLTDSYLSRSRQLLDRQYLSIGTEPGLGIRGTVLLLAACGGFGFRLCCLANKGFLLLLLYLCVCRACLLLVRKKLFLCAPKMRLTG